MFSRIRTRITYANVVMMLALMFAMGGGAYAASKVIITSTKQISPKVLKALKGQAGRAGAQGAAGPQGPEGKAGAVGKDGSNGTNGTSGTNGTNGSSVTSVTLTAKNAHCAEGGSEFIASESKKTYACNGSPWTAGGTLPEGATETGTWAVESTASATEELRAATISFPIRLAAGANGPNFMLAKQATDLEHCEGDLNKPEAKHGQLCVFEGESLIIHLGGLEYAKAAVNPNGELGVANTGAQLVFTTTQTGRVSAEGTWAVTG